MRKLRRKKIEQQLYRYRYYIKLKRYIGYVNNEFSLFKMPGDDVKIHWSTFRINWK